jgi:glycosyltransferase involved in cell wall biosynthesis
MSMPVDRGGCGQYRIRQPFYMLKAHTPHDVHVVDQEHDMTNDLLRALPLVDVFVVRQGVPISDTKMRFRKVMEELSKAAKKEIKLKGKWVMDIDDNMELISPYNEHYMDNGVEEYFDKNLGKWLWKDGENRFDLKKNRQRLELALGSLRDADMVTVTTPKLAIYAKHYNKNVAVLPNSIDFSQWWKLDIKPNKQLRVGWSGGFSHYEDWHTIKEPLNRLLREFRFKLVMVGTFFKGIIDEDLRYLVEDYAWVDFSGHSFRMMCMNLDLAIIPLANLPFNHYKSAVKWYEMSAAKIPCVVADIEPYKKEIAVGERSWGYLDAISFEKAVREALGNANLRKEYAENAYNWVFKHRNAKTNAKLWADAYESLL